MRSKVGTTTMRLSDETLSRIDTLAARLNRSRSWIINQAIDSYLAHEEWIVQEIHDGLTDLEQNNLATDDDIRRVYSSFADPTKPF